MRFLETEESSPVTGILAPSPERSSRSVLKACPTHFILAWPASHCGAGTVPYSKSLSAHLPLVLLLGGTPVAPSELGNGLGLDQTHTRGIMKQNFSSVCNTELRDSLHDLPEASSKILL